MENNMKIKLILMSTALFICGFSFASHIVQPQVLMMQDADDFFQMQPNPIAFNPVNQVIPNQAPATNIQSSFLTRAETAFYVLGSVSLGCLWALTKFKSPVVSVPLFSAAIVSGIAAYVCDQAVED